MTHKLTPSWWPSVELVRKCWWGRHVHVPTYPNLLRTLARGKQHQELDPRLAGGALWGLFFCLWWSRHHDGCVQDHTSTTYPHCDCKVEAGFYEGALAIMRVFMNRTRSALSHRKLCTL